MKTIRASVPAACEACGEAGERACVLRGCEGWRGSGRGTYVRPKGDQPCVRAGRARAVCTCTGCDQSPTDHGPSNGLVGDCSKFATAHALGFRAHLAYRLFLCN